MKKRRINRMHKDRLFLMVFKEKTALLELYNALNKTDYMNAEDLEITTLEDAVYMRMKNDVSFIFNHELHLYEHQSSYSGNMPLRGFLYLADVLRGYIEKHNWNIFSSKQIPLPLPRYVVFYNGKRDEPDRREIRLSEAYEVQEAEPCLEFRAVLLNVNFGCNQELMERSRKLYEYSKFIYYIRENQQRGDLLRDAVDGAVERCIREGILKSFLLKHRGEVYQLLLTEYDEQKFLEQEREVWKEEGHREGLSEGLSQGLTQGLSLGLNQGRAEGEERMGHLLQLLVRSSRDAEIERAVTDLKFRAELLDEFKL